MEYIQLTEENLDGVIRCYVDYYNTCERGCWTYEKAYKRIHQVMTTEDADCFVLYDKEVLIGFVMGFYKEYDDLRGYFLEEIVVFKGHQNKGYGSAMLAELEKRIRQNDATLLELISVKDEHHMHFYKKAGFYSANNLTLMGKHFA